LTAIVHEGPRARSALALPGLVLPGLGHLVPWAGTAWFGANLAFTRWRLGDRRDAQARALVAGAEDAARTWFARHGEHGDLWIGLNLFAHLGLLVWAAVAGSPRLTAILFSGPAGSLDTHAVVATASVPLLAVILWFVAYRRAFPRPLTADQRSSNGQVFLRAFKKNRNGMVGLFGAFTMISIAVLTPLIAPFDPIDLQALGVRFAPPGWVTHPETQQVHFAVLGTDSLGRDLFSRVLFGARISLSIGFVAIGIAGTIGTTLGAASGYFGGWVDAVITWVIDLLLAVPRLVLLLAILGIFAKQDLTGSSKLFLIIVVLGLTGWMGVSRIVRGQVLSLSRQEFIQAARSLGLSPLRILYRHLVPNALAPVIVYASLAIGATILTEASLSFLGLGISQPTPTWGSLVDDGRKSLLNSPWLATFPGLLIVWTVLSFNLLGDGLRDALDPKQRGE
jgi:peptide/nickel transport system permease protein